MKHSVNVRLSEFACEAVAGDDRDPDHVAEAVARAIRCYVGDRGSSGTGWSYPGLPQADGGGSAVEVRLDIDDDLWRALGEEAEKQGASTPQMVGHAALWFAAEVDAGRIAQRVVDGLDEARDGETKAR